jgi:fumarate hydratase class I
VNEPGSLYDSLDFGEDEDYRRLDLPAPVQGGDGRLVVDAVSLEALSREAFSEIAFRLPASQLEGFAAIAKDAAASDAERFVALSLIRNAAVAAEGVYPLCQDTGAANVHGWRGDGLAPEGAISDAEALARGAREAYAARRLRASVLAPSSFLDEANTGDNLPIHADLRAVPGSAYRLAFSAKGGGSMSRTSLSMETPALLDAALLEARLEALVKGLGPSACPPYRIVCVLGGLSPEEALETLTLAGLGLLDRLPRAPGAAAHGAPPGSAPGMTAAAGACPAARAKACRAMRDTDWESRIAAIAARSGIGAQFGGSRLALDARAIRLPRHAASLPLAFGACCAASRHARAIVDKTGFRLERMEEDPSRFLPAGEAVFPGAVRVDLDRPLPLLARELGALEPGTPLLVSGHVLTARDKAHARFHALIAEGKPLPDYLLRHPVFYAGPTEAAPGNASGAFGPTTAGRMDAYLAELTARGASLVTIAKGSRSAKANAAIREAGGAYLCAIGGAAALAGRDHIVSSRLVDYPELGMEAVRLVELRELPVIVGSNAAGRNFYDECAKDPA